MIKTTIKKGQVRLTSPNGVKDMRTGDVYREAFVKESDVKHFVDA